MIIYTVYENINKTNKQIKSNKKSIWFTVYSKCETRLHLEYINKRKTLKSYSKC